MVLSRGQENIPEIFGMERNYSEWFLRCFVYLLGCALSSAYGGFFGWRMGMICSVLFYQPVLKPFCYIFCWHILTENPSLLLEKANDMRGIILMTGPYCCLTSANTMRDRGPIYCLTEEGCFSKITWYLKTRHWMYTAAVNIHGQLTKQAIL